MKTTAIYPNRIEDKELLDPALPEFGNETTKFFMMLEDGLHSELFAQGYERVVYGDHGPYIEFDHKHIKQELVSKFHNKIDINNLPTDSKIYYYWLHPVNHPELKVYLQIKPVSNLPNAPNRSDGKRSKFNRVEGYADYRRGFYYVDPKDLQWSDDNEHRMFLTKVLFNSSNIKVAVYRGENGAELHAYLLEPDDPIPTFACVMMSEEEIKNGIHAFNIKNIGKLAYEPSPDFQPIDDYSDKSIIKGLKEWANRVFSIDRDFEIQPILSDYNE